MVDVHTVYSSRADIYEALVTREDYQGNILKTLLDITQFVGKDVVELGAGTGRITLMLAQFVKSIQAFDKSDHMLSIARQKLEKTGLTNWSTEVAEHQTLPLLDGAADIVISGWSICYSALDNPETWQDDLRKTLAEMRRVVKPGGTIIILDSLGTGFETPTPPEDLIQYFEFLKNDGFTTIPIRTDYKFETMEIAEQVVRGFFGDSLADRVVKDQLLILPECTAVMYQNL
jgi:ubiquinone/menaquinone biosynthesis C-methylase UbiE